nr:MAG TPA: hypothetical protein [Caudoviricetes sp.]
MGFYFSHNILFLSYHSLFVIKIPFLLQNVQLFCNVAHLEILLVEQLYHHPR